MSLFEKQLQREFQKEKAEIIRSLEGDFERPLQLSEISIIESATTREELVRAKDTIMYLMYPSHQYEPPSVTTISAGNVLTSGSLSAPDDYAKMSAVNSWQPTKLNIPVLNTMVVIPINEPKLKEEMIEKGIDLIADLMAIDGVQEVLEKYGVEIKPL